LVGSPSNALLCDFGLSRIRHECTRTHTIIREGGRIRFLAPELSDGPEEFRTSVVSDIFSLAMTFFNVWELQVPFVKFSEKKAGALIRNGLRPERPATHIDLPSEMEEEFWQLIESMWAHAAGDRPSSQDVQKRLETVFGPVLKQRKAISSQ
jgi:serine/threonine protein kinase